MSSPSGRYSVGPVTSTSIMAKSVGRRVGCMRRRLYIALRALKRNSYGCPELHPSLQNLLWTSKRYCSGRQVGSRRQNCPRASKSASRRLTEMLQASRLGSRRLREMAPGFQNCLQASKRNCSGPAIRAPGVQNFLRACKTGSRRIREIAPVVQKCLRACKTGFGHLREIAPGI